jgi:mRNA interferase MazF
LIAREAAYTILSSFAVAPLTTRVRRMATAVLLDPQVDPVPEQCIVSLDHIQVIDGGWLVDPVGQLSAARMAEIDLALHRALGIEVCPTR